MLRPKVVALIGASAAPGTVGRSLMENLRSFDGFVYPINPKRSSVLGLEAFPSVQAVPTPVDLAVIATPAVMVPQVVKECAEAGVKGAVIISAGFKECGAEGKKLEEGILASRGKMRLIGPNCLGVMIPELGLNAMFSKNLALPGNVAFVSQSGALCASVLDWSLREKVGFSALVSTGSMIDVDWGDLICYLANDLGTRSILIYMESIGNARSFLSAAREVALRKPIIVMKVGRTEAGARAVAAHTGTAAGNDDVLDAAFRRVGILRCETIEDLFEMAEVLGKQPRPNGCRLAVVTNAGGPGVLATDLLVKEGGEIAALSEQSVHFRYFGLLTVEQRTAHGRLTRICFNDYEREIAIVAVRRSSESDQEEIIAVGRLIKVHGANQSEFALVVGDECQGEGLGTHLLKLLLEIGRLEGIEIIFGYILPENYTMQRVCKNLGFTVNYDRFEEVMKAEITL
jgi:acetyltransferase